MALALVVAALWGLAGAVLAGLVLYLVQRRRVQQRLGRLGLQPESEARQLLTLDVRTMAGLLGEWLRTRWPREAERGTNLVESAGLLGRVSPAELMGWKVVGLGVGVLITLVAVLARGEAGLIALPALLFVTWVGPDLWLVRRGSARQRGIFVDLPTVIDLLSLSLGAGMSLDRAIRSVCERVASPLSEELQRVLNDIDLGVARGQAFRRMAQRVKLDEIASLSIAIVQAEELGTSLVSVMQAQARQVRLYRRRYAEAEAMRAPIKMMFPMVLFILPALFIIVLGPAGLQVMKALGGG